MGDQQLIDLTAKSSKNQHIQERRLKKRSSLKCYAAARAEFYNTHIPFNFVLKREKISKNFFSPPPKFLFFVTAFFSTFFLSLQFSHQNPLKIILPLHLGKEKNFEKKKNQKKNQEDSTPFLLRSKKIHPEILLGLSCFANLN